MAGIVIALYSSLPLLSGQRNLPGLGVRGARVGAVISSSLGGLGSGDPLVPVFIWLGWMVILGAGVMGRVLTELGAIFSTSVGDTCLAWFVSLLWSVA